MHHSNFVIDVPRADSSFSLLGSSLGCSVGQPAAVRRYAGGASRRATWGRAPRCALLPSFGLGAHCDNLARRCADPAFDLRGPRRGPPEIPAGAPPRPRPSDRSWRSRPCECLAALLRFPYGEGFAPVKEGLDWTRRGEWCQRGHGSENALPPALPRATKSRAGPSCRAVPCTGKV
jgi:hypothetical protein